MLRREELVINGVPLRTRLGLYHLFRIGRLQISFQTVFDLNRRLSKYVASGMWTSWSLGWLRIYWYDKEWGQHF